MKALKQLAKVLAVEAAGLGVVSIGQEWLVIHASMATVDAALKLADDFEARYGWTVAVRS